MCTWHIVEVGVGVVRERDAAVTARKRRAAGNDEYLVVERDEQVHHLLGLRGPHAEQRAPELVVLVVHLLRRAHLYAQRLADQREQNRREAHRPVVRNRHVHPDQLLHTESSRIEHRPDHRTDTRNLYLVLYKYKL